MKSDFPEKPPSARGVCSGKGRRDYQQKKYNEQDGIPVERCAESHKHPGKSGHLRTQLPEHLLEDGHDLYK